MNGKNKEERPLLCVVHAVSESNLEDVPNIISKEAWDINRVKRKKERKKHAKCSWIALREWFTVEKNRMGGWYAEWPGKKGVKLHIHKHKPNSKWIFSIFIRWFYLLSGEVLWLGRRKKKKKKKGSRFKKIDVPKGKRKIRFWP